MRKNRFLRWILLAVSCACGALFSACNSCNGGQAKYDAYLVQFQSEKYTKEYHYSLGATLLEPQTPMKGGYTFVGWFYPQTGEYWDFEKDVVTGETLLVAHFKAVENTLIFYANDGTDKSFSVSAQTGEIRYIPECPYARTGYQFIGWGENKREVRYAVGDAYEVKNSACDYSMTYSFYAIWV